MSSTTTSDVVSHKHSKKPKASTTTQPGTRHQDYETSLPPTEAARKISAIDSSSSTGCTRDLHQEGTPSHIPLTTSALHEYDLQQPGSFKMPSSRHTSRQCNATNSEVVLNRTDDSTLATYVLGRDDVNSPLWKGGSSLELSRWDNDLAGVGEHLTEYSYQEYAGLDKLVVE
jgi:hypothetical protein